MSPRELIGFLVSCIRSGERLSPQDAEVVAGVLAGLASAPEQQAKIEALVGVTTEAVTAMSDTYSIVGACLDQMRKHRSGPGTEFDESATLLEQQLTEMVRLSSRLDDGIGHPAAGTTEQAKIEALVEALEAALCWWRRDPGDYFIDPHFPTDAIEAALRLAGRQP